MSTRDCLFKIYCPTTNIALPRTVLARPSNTSISAFDVAVIDTPLPPISEACFLSFSIASFIDSCSVRPASLEALITPKTSKWGWRLEVKPDQFRRVWHSAGRRHDGRAGRTRSRHYRDEGQKRERTALGFHLRFNLRVNRHAVAHPFQQRVGRPWWMLRPAQPYSR